jgi:hypothetical protein
MDLAVNEKGTIEKFDYAGSVPSLVDSKSKGQAEPVSMPVTKKVVYKCKWLIQTDYMYDWGMSENQIRQPSSWWDTKLNIQLYSWNFYKMRFAGITERLIPLEDKACLAWFRLQNMSNKLIPYLINIDLNALEGVDFGGGGDKMNPTKVMDFIFSNFVVPYRSTDLLSQNPNYKPVSIEASGQLAVFGQLYQELQNTIDMMRQISGLNELTDGSTPNAKTLVPVIILAFCFFLAKYLVNLLSKKPLYVIIPLAFAILQIFFAGSTPKTLIFFFLNPSSKIPILLPMSITRSLLDKLNLEIIEAEKLL